LPEFTGWLKARDEVKGKAKAIATRLRDWVHNEASDLVLAEFNRLTATASQLKFRTL
jgi:hypothetical protein